MLTDIYNYLRIDEQTGTAGQPTADQFQEIRDSGFEMVINLALPTSDDAIADEGALVTGFGMSYLHIPVDFASPQSEEFRLFNAAMNGCSKRSVFVHCAANKRVSAFVYLYRVINTGIAPAEAEKDLHKVWQPNEVWSQFIDSVIRASK
jgi:protein tyrosine phosphatase (PTP) superfamily phosphohydrolase (DUF442 family)